MENRKFKILNINESCVLLQKNRGDLMFFKVVDVENDTIYMGYDEETAKKVYEEYDITKVREERKETFKNWLKEFAEA